MRFNRKKSSVMPKIFLFGACALALGIFGAFSLKSSADKAAAEEPAVVVEEALPAINMPVSSSEKNLVVRGKTYTPDELRGTPENKKKFFEVDKQAHDLIVGIGRELYMKIFWEEVAKKENTTVDKAMQNYVEKNVKVTQSDIDKIMEQIKDQPSFKGMPEKDKLEQVKNYLKSQGTRSLFEEILARAEKNKELIFPQAPEEPRYSIKLTSEDHLRYGPDAKDTNPIQCKGNDCPIVVIEYSEFQCPFCQKALDPIKQVLSDPSLKGKIVWTMRHYPLPFHPDATPAAIAATCAGEQNQFWGMYYKLFQDTKNLKPETFNTYAKELALDEGKFKACLSSDKAKATVTAQTNEAQSYDVNGTPAFFINGRKLSGALPHSEFMKVITEELRLLGAKASEDKPKL